MHRMLCQISPHQKNHQLSSHGLTLIFLFQYFNNIIPDTFLLFLNRIVLYKKINFLNKKHTLQHHSRIRCQFWVTLLGAAP